MPNYDQGQRVQVKNTHSGHWVYADVISNEPDGVAVQYVKNKKNELVKESRVRLPVPKKNHSKKKGTKVTTSVASAAPKVFERTVHPVIEPVIPAVSVHQPRKELLEPPVQPQRAPEAPSRPTPKDRAQIVLTEVEKALDAARLKREAIDNEIAALSSRKVSLETYIKLDEEFNR